MKTETHATGRPANKKISSRAEPSGSDDDYDDDDVAGIIILAKVPYPEKSEITQEFVG